MMDEFTGMRARTRQQERMRRRTDVGDVSPLRGHASFDSAFREALEVTQAGALPKEIRLRRNPGDGRYTWTVRY